MDRLLKSGRIRPADAKTIGPSRIGLGFEKLDRRAFEPENAYAPVAATGVHYIRLQSGWQRTERVKGVYDFAWLDELVDRFITQGQEPWICLCYGNDLYTEEAAQYFGAVGCPPIHTEEEKQGWAAYVRALVEHFHTRVSWWEVWNEPDGQWCWKHGVSASEYAVFAMETADVIHAADPEAKVIAGVLCNVNLPYTREMLDCGLADHVEALSFHRYMADELDSLQQIRALRALISRYSPWLQIIQGESGTQSDSRGAGALRGGAWNEVKQAKYLLRHRLIDLASEVTFTSHFTAMDMIEALNGTSNDKASWQDFGYFGVLHAEFDENGIASGTYTPKLSYRALQHLTALFPEDVMPCDLPVIRKVEPSPRVFGTDDASSQLVMLGFEKQSGGQALAFWKAADLMRETYEGTVSLALPGEERPMELIDLMSGVIYTLPDSMKISSENGVILLKNLPLTDTPYLLTFGEFVSPDRRMEV